MISFVYGGTITSLKIAARLAETTMNSEDFLTVLSRVSHFAMSSKGQGIPVMGKDLAELIRKNNIVFAIRTYKGWFWSKVNAYTIGGDPKSIYMNTKKLGRDTSDIAATIAHESIHLLDFASPWIFGHNDNSPSGKEKTAPWIIGFLVEKILTKE